MAAAGAAGRERPPGTSATANAAATATASAATVAPLPAPAASAAITDQSDAWVRVDVTGGDVVAMLERLSGADTRRMQAGSATRPAIHHMHCVIVCRAGGTDFTILGPRSSAASLHHALVAAAASL